MIQNVTKEIGSEIRDLIFGKDERIDRFDINKSIYGYFLIHADSMSGFAHPTLSNLLKIADLLGCNEGEIQDSYRNSQCNTCSFGAVYEITFKFWNK
jgi:hypothetical protein